MRSWKSFSANFATLAARLILTATNLVITYFATHRMTGEQFGLWTILYAINLLTNGLDLGFQFTLGNRLAALGSRGADGEEERRETYLSIIALQLCLLAVYTIVILIAAPLIPWSRWIADPVLARAVIPYMPAVLIAMVGTLPVGLMWTAFFAYREILLASVLGAVGSCVQAAVFAICVYRCEFIWVVLNYFLFAIVFGIGLNIYLFTRRRWRFSFPAVSRMVEIVRSLAQVSIHACFNTLPAIISQIIGPIVAGAMGGLVMAGEYALVEKLFSFLMTAHLAAIAPIAPATTQDSAAGNWDAVRRRLRVCVIQIWPIFFFGIGLVILFVHPMLIRIWTGRVIRDYPLAALILAWACLGGFVNTFSAFLNSLGLMKVQAAMGMAMLLPAIIAPVLFGHWLGVPGVGLGKALCALPAAIIYPIYMRRALRLQMSRV